MQHVQSLKQYPPVQRATTFDVSKAIESMMQSKGQ
jgi:hypothetical protein